MEHKIREVLKSIGMSKNEIEIYLDLVGHKHSGALDIARRTKIHRSNTYDALRSLVEKGFVSKLPNGKKTLFRAMDPEKIKDYLIQQQQEIDSIIPRLKEISCRDIGEEEVSVAKGVFAVRESLQELLYLNKTINVFGASQKAVDTFGLGFLKEFHANRIKKKILMRHIYHRDAEDRVKFLEKMKYTEARLFPKAFSKGFTSNVATNVCGDIVLLLLFTNPLLSITIKNKDIADTYHAYFEALWQNAEQ